MIYFLKLFFVTCLLLFNSDAILQLKILAVVKISVTNVLSEETKVILKNFLMLLILFDVDICYLKTQNNHERLFWILRTMFIPNNYLLFLAQHGSNVDHNIILLEVPAALYITYDYFFYYA